MFHYKSPSSLDLRLNRIEIKSLTFFMCIFLIVGLILLSFTYNIGNYTENEIKGLGIPWWTFLTLLLVFFVELVCAIYLHGLIDSRLFYVEDEKFRDSLRD